MRLRRIRRFESRTLNLFNPYAPPPPPTRPFCVLPSARSSHGHTQCSCAAPRCGRVAAATRGGPCARSFFFPPSIAAPARPGVPGRALRQGAVLTKDLCPASPPLPRNEPLAPSRLSITLRDCSDRHSIARRSFAPRPRSTPLGPCPHRTVLCMAPTTTTSVTVVTRLARADFPFLFQRSHVVRPLCRAVLSGEAHVRV